VLTVEIEDRRVTYRVQSADPVTAHHSGLGFTVTATSPVNFTGQYRTLDTPPA
jgi:hypothetical protein